MSYGEASFLLPGTSFAFTDADMVCNACLIYLVITVNARNLICAHTINWVIIGAILQNNLTTVFVLYMYSVSAYLIIINVAHKGP